MHCHMNIKFIFTDNAVNNPNRNQLDNERLKSYFRVETFQTYPHINILVTDKQLQSAH